MATFVRSSLVGRLLWAEDSADFRLNFQVVDSTGQPVAEVGTLDVGDPQLQDKLRLMSQAFRMGLRKGVEK